MIGDFDQPQGASPRFGAGFAQRTGRGHRRAAMVGVPADVFRQNRALTRPCPAGPLVLILVLSDIGSLPGQEGQAQKVSTWFSSVTVPAG